MKWFIILSVCSISLTLGNKYVAQQYNYSNTIVFLQNILSILFIFICYLTKVITFNKFSLHQLLECLIPAIYLSLQLVSFIKAISYIAIPTIIMFRNISTCIIGFIDFFLFEKKITKLQAFGIFLTFVGGLMYAWRDLNFNPYGYLFIGLNNIIYIMNTVYTKHVLNTLDQTPEGIAFIQQIYLLPIVILYTIVSDEFPDNLDNLVQLSFFTIFILFVLGIFGGLISISYMNLYKRTNVLNIAIAGDINRILAIVLSFFIFSNKFSSIQAIGLFVGCLGISMYVYVDRCKKNKYQQIKQSLESMDEPSEEEKETE